MKSLKSLDTTEEHCLVGVYAALHEVPVYLTRSQKLHGTLDGNLGVKYQALLWDFIGSSPTKLAGPGTSTAEINKRFALSTSYFQNCSVKVYQGRLSIM